MFSCANNNNNNNAALSSLLDVSGSQESTMWRWSSIFHHIVPSVHQLILVRGHAGKQSSQLCTSINVYFSLLLHQHIFSSFLSSNFYYTSIISIRTKSGRIHLNKTNFAAIIEKTREMLFQDTTVWRTTEFQWFRQSQNTRYSTSSNRYNIYRERYPKNVFIF